MPNPTKSIIGKTITGVIARPAADALDGRGPQSTIVMLQFSDGSCFEFVSNSSQKAGKRKSRNNTPLFNMEGAGLTADLFSQLAA